MTGAGAGWMRVMGMMGAQDRMTGATGMMGQRYWNDEGDGE